MTALAFLAACIFGMMLAESRLSLQHERALRRTGALEPAGDVYRAMAVLYPGSFLLITAEGLWRAHAPHETGGPSWMASGILLFAASKALKYWAIATLGPRWSFRVLIQPGRPLVATGPYRYVTHPNYIGVMGELAGAAMMMGATFAAPVTLVLFGLVLRARIRFEDRALAALVPAASRPPRPFEEKG